MKNLKPDVASCLSQRPLPMFIGGGWAQARSGKSSDVRAPGDVDLAGREPDALLDSLRPQSVVRRLGSAPAVSFSC